MTNSTKIMVKYYDALSKAERQARLERQSYTSEMKFSKMKLEWLKE